MWSFVKANPWMFAIGLTILALAIVGVVLGIVLKGNWKDRGLMVRDGHALKWLLDSMPIAVLFATDLPDYWVTAYREARNRFEVALGLGILDLGTHAPEDLNTERAPLDCILLVVGDEDPKHASTEHRYDKRSGTILAAKVTLPHLSEQDQEAKAEKIMLHEVCGHALGLAHDEQRESIMHSHIQDREQLLLDSDIKLLRETYTPKE